MSQVLKTAVKTLLEADPTFNNLMVGGIYDTAEKIERQETPGAFDGNDEIQPCCIIRAENVGPFEPHPHTGRAFFAIVFYQNRGVVDINAASKRAYELLHRGCLPNVAIDVRRVGSLPDQEDPALNCPMIIDRYQGVADVRNI